MSRRFFLLVAVLGFMSVGQGCASAPAATTAPRPSVAQPLRQPETTPLAKTDVILGITLPRTGVVAFRESTIPKQDVAVFYGPSYRLAANIDAPDRSLGHAYILNVTDPTRDPEKTLRDPLQRLLGCVNADQKYGAHCDMAKAALSTIGGLSVRTYPIRYTPATSAGVVAVSVTSTAWLIAVPTNQEAWLFVVPADFQDVAAMKALGAWVKGMKKAM